MYFKFNTTKNEILDHLRSNNKSANSKDSAKQQQEGDLDSPYLYSLTPNPTEKNKKFFKIDVCNNLRTAKPNKTNNNFNFQQVNVVKSHKIEKTNIFSEEKRNNDNH